MNLNKVFIIGRVTKDPEIRMFTSGTKVASFSMATNRFYTKDHEKVQETEFHNISLFGKLAEIVERYVQKGALILVEGRIKTDSWEKDGVKRYATKIIGESIQLGPRPGNGTASKKEYAGEATQEEQTRMDHGLPPEGSEEIDVSDLQL